MKIIDVVAERNYSVVVGANGPDEIKSISAERKTFAATPPKANSIAAEIIKNSARCFTRSTLH